MTNANTNRKRAKAKGKAQPQPQRLRVFCCPTRHRYHRALCRCGLDRSPRAPTKQALGDYMFFLDLEGRAEDPALQTALNCLRLKLREVKVLGTYPVD